MDTMKLISSLLFLCMVSAIKIDVIAQDMLTLSQCQEQAIEHSPLQKQKLYMESMSELNSKNLKNINYPQLILNGQASYQSDVFSLPFQVPGVETPIIPQDQYKVALDFYQNIYNGGVSKSTIRIEDAKLHADLQGLEVSFHQIRETINSLYFGILKAQEQIKLMENVKTDLNNQKGIMQARVSEGAALPMAVKILEKEVLSIEQQLVEIEASRQAMLDMLGEWIEQPLDPGVILQLPETSYSNEMLTLDRPESKQFNLQSELLEARKSQLTTSRIPNVGFFGTAGMGNPNPFNWFDSGFQPFWMAGIRLSWTVLDYGKASKDKEVISLQQQSLLTTKENFERTVEISMNRQTSDILKYQQLIDKDQQIVKLQEEIVAVVSSQLKNGVINSNDYILEVNKGLNANISLQVHTIDLAKSKIELLTLTGNSDKL